MPHQEDKSRSTRGTECLDLGYKEHMEFMVTVPLLIIDDLGIRKLPLSADKELLERAPPHAATLQ